MFEQVEKMFASHIDEGSASFESTCVDNEGMENVDPNILRVKGIKKKDGGYKGWGRLKPWHEKPSKRKKVVTQHSNMSKV